MMNVAATSTTNYTLACTHYSFLIASYNNLEQTFKVTNSRQVHELL